MASLERGERAHNKGMHNLILVQGCKSLSLIEDRSKTYPTTYDEIFTVDLLGVNVVTAPQPRFVFAFSVHCFRFFN